MNEKFLQQMGNILGIALLFSATIINSAIANEDESYNLPSEFDQGGGVRGKSTVCSSNGDNPIPLIPGSSPTLTTSNNPELLFKVPDVIHASTLSILLLNHDKELVYQDELDPGYRPGIVSVSLTDQSNSNGLKIDSPYHWYLIQQCDGVASPNIVADGSLTRINLEQNLATKIANASGLEKIKLYQSADIWHEAIANLVQLKCNYVAEGMTEKQRIEIEQMEREYSFFPQSYKDYCVSNL